MNPMRFERTNKSMREKENESPVKQNRRKRKSTEITVRLMRSKEMRKQWRFINRIGT